MTEPDAVRSYQRNTSREKRLCLPPCHGLAEDAMGVAACLGKCLVSYIGALSE